jgi:hypothetical protein
MPSVLNKIFLTLLAMVASSFICVTSAKAEQVITSPTYFFNGTITETGLIPGPSACPISPCTATIDVSFDFYLNQYPDSAFGTRAFPTIVDGTFDVAEVGPLPSVVGVLNGNGGTFNLGFPLYLGLGFAGNEIDLEFNSQAGADPNAFGAGEFSCDANCRTFFGGVGTIFELPVQFTFTVAQVPEPKTFLMLLQGGFVLALLGLIRRYRVRFVISDYWSPE